MRKVSILIVDDEISFLRSLRRLLWDRGYENVEIIQNPLDVMPALSNLLFDLIILDISMPELSGLTLLEEINQKYPQIPVIMLTAVDNVETALTAVKLGAYEYIVKPPENERLLLTIKRGLEQRLINLERDSLRSLKQTSKKNRDNFPEIITQSPLMDKVFELIEIFAPTDETILIVGETGTGKDLIAKKIHDLSPRKNAAFVPVNLASISSTLFESELFGHLRGAFTGATQDKTGFFEAANNGTIFLDEIGELPRELQGKLLRVIQYSEIYRIGSTKPIKLNTRIIAATNKDLSVAVDKNEFRADLFYRLNRGYIQLPPLHQRKGDIKLLAEYFLEQASKKFNKSITGFAEHALIELENYSFPGNIRELENIVYNSVAKTKDNDSISTFYLPESNKAKILLSINHQNELSTIEDAIQKHISFVLNEVNGNIQKAASILGISERTLQRRLQSLRKQKNKN